MKKYVFFVLYCVAVTGAAAAEENLLSVRKFNPVVGGGSSIEFPIGDKVNQRGPGFNINLEVGLGFPVYRSNLIWILTGLHSVIYPITEYYRLDPAIYWHTYFTFAPNGNMITGLEFYTKILWMRRLYRKIYYSFYFSNAIVQIGEYSFQKDQIGWADSFIAGGKISLSLFDWFLLHLGPGTRMLNFSGRKYFDLFFEISLSAFILKI